MLSSGVGVRVRREGGMRNDQEEGERVRVNIKTLRNGFTYVCFKFNIYFFVFRKHLQAR